MSNRAWPTTKTRSWRSSLLPPQLSTAAVAAAASTPPPVDGHFDGFEFCDRAVDGLGDGDTLRSLSGIVRGESVWRPPTWLQVDFSVIPTRLGGGDTLWFLSDIACGVGFCWPATRQYVFLAASASRRGVGDRLRSRCDAGDWWPVRLGAFWVVLADRAHGDTLRSLDDIACGVTGVRLHGWWVVSAGFSTILTHPLPHLCATAGGVRSAAAACGMSHDGNRLRPRTWCGEWSRLMAAAGVTVPGLEAIEQIKITVTARHTPAACSVRYPQPDAYMAYI